MDHHQPPSLPFLNFYYRGYKGNGGEGEMWGSTYVHRGTFPKISSGSSALRLTFTVYICITVVVSREDVALLPLLATVSETFPEANHL